MNRLLPTRHLRLVLAVSTALACQGDSEGEEAREAYVGGWSDEANHLFACFDDDRRMWLGDSAADLRGTTYCSVDEAGAAFHCTDPGGGSPFDGVLEVTGDELTLQLIPCPLENPRDCQSVYARAPSVTCE